MAKRRHYARDAHGRFAAVPGSRAQPAKAGSVHAARLAALRRQRARRVTRATAKAGVVAVAAVAVATQAHPASRTRTAPTRRRIERTHVARARADHASAVTRRAAVFPTSVMGAPKFNARSARAEARALTRGYRGQVKAVRRR